MHRYECAKCELTSAPYLRKSKAKEFGAEHRRKRHDDMYPKEEYIVSEAMQMPQGDEWKVVIIVAVILLGGLLSKVF
jgi:hypothetical protein